ncbi:CYFA0S34e00738g1_1 [Cyberlindnera fabianii]|uniref:Translation initiation factor eIF2B subunit gamma n=1 Tax=Cyberlindnera fabianii TaxID=36022 RepID=A0A061BE34_CYBFA|nr:Translation initiation factor eIF-2B subunit gamma [Cyberlindnera fabianii]CDR47612.1 CYFA0S34e00738g1_1 [Cyberlindnera fabianii]
MEFHAVICCGKGVNLSPFSSARESGVPKTLLPIANRPMIEYVLSWCDQAPFRQISVVCDSESLETIKSVVQEYESTKRPDSAKINAIEMIEFNGDSTGEIFEQIIDLEKENLSEYVLLPCDFITDIPPEVLIETYRNRDESDIAMSVNYHNKFESIDKKSLTHYYTVHSQGRLLDIFSRDSVIQSKFLGLRTQMSWRYPAATVSTKLLDSFIYFFSIEALKALRSDVELHGRSITKLVRDLARRSWKHSEEKGTISLLVLPDQCTFIRADNIAAYTEANRYLMKIKARESAPQPKPEKGAATVGADSEVGENTVLGERTSVKKTVVGKNCTIGKRCRLTGCVLLDGIILEDDVVLENCVIGQKAVIHSKARLTNCNVEGGYVVAKGNATKGETLTNLFIAQDGDSDSSDEESDFESEYDDYDDDEEDDGLFER